MVYILYFCLALAGYLIGSLSPSILLARKFHIDILNEGSGNAGATNVRRLMGTRRALLVLLIDFLKAFVPVLLLRISGPLPGVFHALEFPLSGMVVLAGVVIGHVFPLYFSFRGGKGVAALAGGWFAILPLECAAAVLVFAAVVGIFRRVSLGAVTVAVFLPVFYCIRAAVRFGAVDLLPAAALLLSGIFILWTHRANIGRLLRGTEPALGAGAGGGTGGGKDVK